MDERMRELLDQRNTGILSEAEFIAAITTSALIRWWCRRIIWCQSLRLLWYDDDFIGPIVLRHKVKYTVLHVVPGAKAISRQLFIIREKRRKNA